MIDISVEADIESASKQLYRYEKQVLPQSIASALNKTRKNAQTAGNRQIAKTTGLAVRKDIAANQWYIAAWKGKDSTTLVMRKRAFNLRRFVSKARLKVGGFSNQPGVKANPWKRSQTFRGSFIIRGATHGQAIVVARTSKARKPLKGLYGPALHIEFRRPAVQRIMREVISKRFRINLEAELNHRIRRLNA